MELRARTWNRPGRVHTGDLYDLAYGPLPPRVYRRVPDEWDDPTWIAVEVDHEFMADELARVAREEELARRRSLEQKLFQREAADAGIPVGKYRRHRAPSDASMDAVLAALAAGPATVTQVQTAAGLTSTRTTRTLRWLTALGDVRRAMWPGTGEVFYRLATPEASRIWNAMTIDAREQIARAESTGRWGGHRGRVETDQTRAEDLRNLERVEAVALAEEEVAPLRAFRDGGPARAEVHQPKAPIPDPSSPGPETTRVSPRLRPSARRAGRRPQSDVTPTDVTLAGINAALDAGPATTAIVAAATGFTANRVLNGLRWLTQVGEVRSDQHPATRQVFYWPATPEGDDAWRALVEEARRQIADREENRLRTLAAQRQEDRRRMGAYLAANKGRLDETQLLFDEVHRLRAFRDTGTPPDGGRRYPQPNLSASHPTPSPSTRRKKRPPVRRKVRPVSQPVLSGWDRIVLQVLVGDTRTVAQLTAAVVLDGVSRMAVPVIVQGLAARGLIEQVDGDWRATVDGHQAAGGAEEAVGGPEA